MEKSINLYRFQITLIQIIDGIFEKPLSDMSQYDKGIHSYKELLHSSESIKELDLIKNDLKVIFNNEEKFDLEKLFYDSYNVYADSHEQVRILLMRFWNIFFPDEHWKDPDFCNSDLLIYADKAEYEAS